MTRPPTSRAGCSRPRRTASRCRSRSCYRTDLALDGSAPCLLYGYGAYGIAMPAGVLAPTRLSLVDRGFVYAIAHIRGGTDKGWRWYVDGKRETQAQHLHRLHRLRRASGRRSASRRAGRIVAQGGSAGGMLMGAVANMAPGPVRGRSSPTCPSSTCSTRCSTTTLPLTPPEWPEWGNPIDGRGGLRHHPRLLAL